MIHPLTELRTYIRTLLPLPEADWEAFGSLFSEAQLNRGDYFAEEDRFENSIGFLRQGVIRAFYRSPDGTEYNKTFFTDQEFLGAYSALVGGQVNRINLQALADCRILKADYREIVQLFPQYRSIETLARLLAEKLFLEKEKREIELVLLGAQQRYQLFQNEYPNLENLIPQYHIASYLGVTPTQLSRIRAKR
jgi:CRP-like cAMP-binding protein